MINLSFLIACLLDNVGILWGKVTCQSLLGTKEFKILTKCTVSVSWKVALFLLVVSTICFWISAILLSSSADRRCCR